MSITITNILILITVVVSYATLKNMDLFLKYRHHPYTESRQKSYITWLTSGFLHGDYVHLAVNMFVLWQFGNTVERIYVEEFGAMGSILYLIMYLSAIVFANLPSFRKHKDNPQYTAVGASGAVAAVIFTYILFFPWNGLYIYGIIPLRAVVGGLLYLLYEQWASQNAQDNVGHDAHFAGAIYGMLFIVLVRPSIYNDFVDRLIYQMPPFQEIFIF